MKRHLILWALGAFVLPAQGTEVVRHDIDVRLVPGALKASATLDLARAVDRPVLCVAAAVTVDPPFERERGGDCGAGLHAWSLREDGPVQTVTLSWTIPAELGSQPLVLGGAEAWFPRGREKASAMTVRADSALEGVTLISNAPSESSRALELEEVSLLAGRWKAVRLRSGSDALEFYSMSAGFDAPAFSAVAMLRKATEHFGALPGGRHVFVEVPAEQRIDAHGLSAWPAGVMLEEEARDLRLAEALLTSWWGGRARAVGDSVHWSSGARLYVATHVLLGRGGPMTRIEWIDEFALADRGGRSARRETLRAAMVFHALRQVAGDEAFDEALRDLSRRPPAAASSWNDLRALFAQKTRGRSDWVFDALVEGPGAPRIVLESVSSEERPGRRGLRVRLASPDVARVDVEVRVTGESGDTRSSVAALAEGSAEIVLRSRSEPLFLEVDPDAHLLRALDDEELPPMLGLIGDREPVLVLLGTGRGEGFLSAARRFARTRFMGRVLLDREVTPEDLARAERVWVVGRPGEELSGLLARRLPLASKRLQWLGERAVGPAEAQVEGGDAWLLAGLGRWPGEGARIVLLDAPQISGLVAATREARAEGAATWRVRTAEGKLVEGRGPRSAKPLVRRMGEEIKR